jgi:hypothetical protein
MSTQVERTLDYVARLSTAEQQELRELLRRLLPATAGPSGLTMAAVERAIAFADATLVLRPTLADVHTQAREYGVPERRYGK